MFEQIFDSSIASDYTVRHMFMDLLVLADAEGAVDMTYDAIARRTNVPIEVVVASIGELMKPDPESRSPTEEGARLVPLDKHRNWGWSIVNYPHYRRLRDEESRKLYYRDKKRESRTRLAKAAAVKTGQRANGSTLGENVQGVHAGPTGQTLSTKEEGEEDEEVLSLSQPSQSPATIRESREQVRVTDPDEAKRLICLHILTGEDPDRIWSPDAESRLVCMCKNEGGIPLVEIEAIGWFRKLPPNEKIPELKKRTPTLSATGLLCYWSDQARHALEYRKKDHARKTPAGKPEPPRWREFFIWKNDNPEIVLPRQFELLLPHLKAEYDRDFQTFVKAVAAAS